MRVTNYLNTNENEVSSKSFNICLGFSLGNKYFTYEHKKSFIDWAYKNTKDTIAIIIPDKIQIVNYEVKNKYNPIRAKNVAMRKGLEIEQDVRKICRELNISESKFKIVHWQDLEDEKHLKTVAVLEEEFKNNMKFHEAVIEMVKEPLHIQNLNLAQKDYEKLAQYIINELPMLINGLEINGVWYTLFPYPGFASLDYLALDLQEGKNFPEITSKLDIQNKLRLVEAYAD